MDNGVIEVVVKKKKNSLMGFLQIFLIVVAVIFVLAGFLMWPLLIVGAAAGVGAWFAYMNVQIDYEYDLVDRELRLARIQNRSRRKSLGQYDLNKMEILAPTRSHQLDSYRGRQDKTVDLSAQDEERKNSEYTLFLNGDTRLILTLEGEEGDLLLKSVRTFAPRKVFFD